MQGSKLYVGNLDYRVTNETLRELFAKHGTVVEVNVIEGKGFGFVEMASPADAEKVKAALDGTEFNERTLRVDEARPRESRPRGDFRTDRPRGGGGGHRRY